MVGGIVVSKAGKALNDTVDGVLNFLGLARKEEKTIANTTGQASKGNAKRDAELRQQVQSKFGNTSKQGSTEGKEIQYAVRLPDDTPSSGASINIHLSGLNKAQNSVTGISKSKALAGAGLTAAGAAMATAALVQSTSSTQNPSGSDAMHTDPSGEDSQTLPNPYDPSEYYAYGFQQGVTDADNEWSNWFNSLFGGAEEQAQQIFAPFEEIPFVGDAVEEVRSKGLALPALIGVIIVLTVAGHLIRKKLRRSGHGKAGRHHKRR